jgi:hypothetical protein
MFRSKVIFQEQSPQDLSLIRILLKEELISTQLVVKEKAEILRFGSRINGHIFPNIITNQTID